jgi:hypothetical protein
MSITFLLRDIPGLDYLKEGIPALIEQKANHSELPGFRTTSA